MEEKKIENKTKINFFKKLWYSIAKVEKYSELKEDTAKDSTKYLAILVAIMAIVISIFPTYSTYKILSNGVKYIQNNIPDFKYEDGILEVDSEEPVYVNANNNNNNLIRYLSKGYNFIIDTNLEDEEKINEYLDDIDGDKKAVLLKNKIVTFEDDKKEEYEYPGAIKSFLNYEKSEFSKEDVINYFSTPIHYYYINNFTSYLFSLFVTFIIMTAAITVIVFAYIKVAKKDLKFKETYVISCYASTLSIILYTTYIILNLIFGLQIKYIDIIYILITFIYLLTSVRLINDKEHEK